MVSINMEKQANKNLLSFLIRHIYRKKIMSVAEIVSCFFDSLAKEHSKIQKRHADVKPFKNLVEQELIRLKKLVRDYDLKQKRFNRT